jgi:ribosome biogenesis protein ERB1
LCELTQFPYFPPSLSFSTSVRSDLTRNPLLVPLKVLRGHGVVGGVGVLSVAFHPKQPWLVTAGADGLINLFQDI